MPCHEPSEIFERNVLEDMLCWRWPTVRRPSENDRSASTEDAGADRYAMAIAARRG